MRIRKNLWQVGGRGMTDPSDAAAYLVRLGEHAALIDAGSGRGHLQLVKNIAECMESGTKLENLLLTHCHFDHAGGAQAIREEFGCRIVAHELDAIYLQSGDDRVTGAARQNASAEPLSVDIKLEGRQAIVCVGDGTITAIHCPGHTPGSVVYTTEIDGELILFGQDLAGPLHSEWLSDEEQYLASLEMVASLKADVLLEGHFGIIESRLEVGEFIQNCITPAPQPCRC